MTQEILKVGEEEVPIEVQPLTVIVPAKDIYEQLSVVNRITLSAEETLYHAERVRKLHKDFESYWQMMFEGGAPEADPEQIRKMGNGMRHLMGLIDMYLKLRDVGVPVFIVDPETFLHPALQVRLGDLIVRWSKEAEEDGRGQT